MSFMSPKGGEDGGLKNLLQLATMGKSSPIAKSRELDGTVGEHLRLLAKNRESPSSSANPFGKEASSEDGTLIESLQKFHLDSINCQTMAISQVKTAASPSSRGKVIAVSKQCLAYVLSDKKIRFIGQETGSVGSMEAHDKGGLPIIDMAWWKGDDFAGSSSILTAGSGGQLIASLSKGGEVLIGNVYAESDVSLVYEALSAITFPELSPARGLRWSNCDDSRILALWGAGSSVFLFPVLPEVSSTGRSASFTTELESIEDVIFDSKDDLLFIAGKDQIVSLSMEMLQENIIGNRVSLPSGVERIWLFNHSKNGSFAVAMMSNSRLLILSLAEGSTEILIALPPFQPTPPPQSSQLFAVFDSVTNCLAIGSHSSSQLYCINLSTLEDPVLAAGKWPNSTGSISVTSATQLHGFLDGQGETSVVDLFLYAYHTDSVKMHRLRIDWNQTESAIEPKKLPSPTSFPLPPIPPPIKRSSSVQPTSALPKKDIRTASLIDSKAPLRESSTDEKLDKVVEKVVERVIPMVNKSVEKSIGKLMEERLIPALNGMLSDLIGQMSANISQAIVDSTLQHGQILNEEINQVRSSLAQVQQSINKLPSQKDIVESISKDLRDCLANLQLNMSSDDTVEMTNETFNVKKNIEKMVGAGEGDRALVEVLSMGDLNLLQWIITQLDPSVILESPLITSRVIVSLIQQLGIELTSLTEVKLEWLAEIFSTFDSTCGGDVECIEQLPTVLDELFANLRVSFASSSSPSMQKNIKMVMRLVRTAMSSL